MTDTVFEALKALEKELRDCQASITDKDTELTQLREQLVVTQGQLDEAREQYGTLQEANTTLEHNLAQQTEEVDRLEHRMTADNNGYRQVREVFEGNIRKLQDELDLVRAQASIFEEDFIQERKDRETAHDMKEEVKLAFDEMKHAKEIECNELTRRNKLLLGELAELKETLKNPQHKWKAAKATEANDAYLVTLTRELTQQLEQSKAEIATTKRQLSEVENENSFLRAEVVQYQQQIHKKCETVSILKKKINEGAQTIEENKVLKLANNELKNLLEQNLLANNDRRVKFVDLQSQVSLQTLDSAITSRQSSHPSIARANSNPISMTSSHSTISHTDSTNCWHSSYPGPLHTIDDSNHQTTHGQSFSLATSPMQSKHSSDNPMMDVRTGFIPNPTLLMANGVQRRLESQVQRKVSCNEQEYVHTTFDNCFQPFVTATPQNRVHQVPTKSMYYNLDTIPDVEPQECEKILDDFEEDELATYLESDSQTCESGDDNGHQEDTPPKSLYANLPTGNGKELYMNLPCD